VFAAWAGYCTGGDGDIIQQRAVRTENQEKYRWHQPLDNA
jgi:hypothetical protein